MSPFPGGACRLTLWLLALPTVPLRKEASDPWAVVRVPGTGSVFLRPPSPRAALIPGSFLVRHLVDPVLILVQEMLLQGMTSPREPPDSLPLSSWGSVAPCESWSLCAGTPQPLAPHSPQLTSRPLSVTLSRLHQRPTSRSASDSPGLEQSPEHGRA